MKLKNKKNDLLWQTKSERIKKRQEEFDEECHKKRYPRVYLVGKVRGTKWDVVNEINNATFVSSDGNNHSEHEWGLSNYSFDDENARLKLEEECLQLIDMSDFLIAWLDTNDSYGSIAEIAYASTKGKKCFIFVKPSPFKDVPEGEFPFSKLYDSYWFISHFPNVETLEVDFDRTKEIIKIICDRNQTKISKDFINGFSSKVILEEITTNEREFIKTLSQYEEEDFEQSKGKQPISKTITFFKRNREIVKQLKDLYKNKCQICGFTFKKDNGENYSETHHIVPLSKNGGDEIKNLIVVCPNCHRKLHYAKKEKYDIKYNKEHYEILKGGIKDETKK